ncbi:MAG: hypothetical protein KGI50_01770 [Patescibacteria group bacterium]|nr:hypothetical protein [Patescibacteria group bacterium]MDE2437928.1 hypothetical protein [Patescibacteria group bacterium]
MDKKRLVLLLFSLVFLGVVGTGWGFAPSYAYARSKPAGKKGHRVRTIPFSSVILSENLTRSEGRGVLAFEVIMGPTYPMCQPLFSVWLDSVRVEMRKDGKAYTSVQIEDENELVGAFAIILVPRAEDVGMWNKWLQSVRTHVRTILAPLTPHRVLPPVTP